MLKLPPFSNSSSSPVSFSVSEKASLRFLDAAGAVRRGVLGGVRVDEGVPEEEGEVEKPWAFIRRS